MEEGARTRGLKGERNGVLGNWGYRDKRWPKCSSKIQLSQGHGLSKRGAQTSFSQERGTWKGRSASLCLLGKLSSLLSHWREWEAVELSSLQRDSRV